MANCPDHDVIIQSSSEFFIPNSPTGYIVSRSDELHSSVEAALVRARELRDNRPNRLVRYAVYRVVRLIECGCACPTP